MLEFLDQKYDERPVGMGLLSGGERVVELLSSAAGTWTVIITDIKGDSCIVLGGESWETLDPNPLKKGTGT